MGSPDTQPETQTSTTLEDAYEAYCCTAYELRRVPAGTERAEKLQQDADVQWLNYVNQGGSREPWHTVQIPWQYQDGFHDLYLGGTLGPIERVRTMLRLTGADPKGAGPVYWYAEAEAVKHFQGAHHLPVTGNVDRTTWQALLREHYEPQKAIVVPRQFDVPGSMSVPVPIRIRTRKRWMLALDDVPYRTYANQSNLAALALLSYSKAQTVTTNLVDQWNVERVREQVAVNEDDGAHLKLFAREASPAFVHEVKVIENGETETQLFVLSCPAYTVIAFRGTESGGDGLTDGKARGQRWLYDGTFDGDKPAGTRGFQVHSGFGGAFDSILNTLQGELDRVLSNSPGSPIFVTGHSLGAALACLCACYLRSHPRYSRHPLQLYTFAQPRVGTLPFARHYWRDDPKFSYFRIANFFDTVTMVPSNYLAEDIASYRGLLDQFFDGALDVDGLLTVLFPVAYTGYKLLLKAACPPELDYRHFGELILCGVDAQNHPFMEHIGEGVERIVEVPTTSGTQSVWRSQPWMHPMGLYIRFLMREFELNTKAYAAGERGKVRLSGEPNLDPMEVQLFYRYISSYGIPPFRSVEEYRSLRQ